MITKFRITCFKIKTKEKLKKHLLVGLKKMVSTILHLKIRRFKITANWR